MLDSMAESHRALARMLSYAADRFPDVKLDESFVRHLAAISDYQKAMADKLATLEPGLIPRKVRRGKPGAPWMTRGAACRREE